MIPAWPVWLLRPAATSSCRVRHGSHPPTAPSSAHQPSNTTETPPARLNNDISTAAHCTGVTGESQECHRSVTLLHRRYSRDGSPRPSALGGRPGRRPRRSLPCAQRARHLTRAISQRRESERGGRVHAAVLRSAANATPQVARPREPAMALLKARRRAAVRKSVIGKTLSSCSQQARRLEHACLRNRTGEAVCESLS